jgi:hypothetical protein
VFREGPRRLEDGDAPVTEVRLSELFTAPDRAAGDLTPRGRGDWLAQLDYATDGGGR